MSKPFVNKLNHKFNSLVIIITCGIYIVPIILDLAVRGWQKLFSFFAADVFYYLVVARNYAQSGILSFDGVYSTNGFHPLWQVILGMYYKFARAISIPDNNVLLGVLAISMLFVLSALILFARAFQNSYGRITPWFMLLPVGIYPILLAAFEPRFGSLWSFTNGMETAPLILSYALIMWLWSRPGFLRTRWSALSVGLALTIFTFSRLDHIFFVAVFFTGVGVKYFLERRPIKLWQNLGIALLIFTFLIGVYLWVNQITTGMVFPVSGSIKTTFPSTMAGKLKFDEITAALKMFGTPDFGLTIWRYTQMILPSVFAIVVVIVILVTHIRKPIPDADQFWLISAGLVIFLGLYNFLYVPTLDQGHWYFPVSIIFISLVTISWLNKIRIGWARWVVPVVLLLGTLYFYYGVYHNSSRNQRFANLYQNRTEIQAAYAVPPKIIEYDDGIIAYSTEFPAMSGFGFCLDKEASAALKQGKLLDLAYSRGYRYLASYYYFGSKFTPQSTPSDIKSFYQSVGSFIGQTNLDDYRFSLDYISQKGDFSIIRFDKK